MPQDSSPSPPLTLIRRRWPTLAAAMDGPSPGPLEQASGGWRYRGIGLASAVDEAAEGAMQAARIPPESPSAWLYGPGLGALPRALLARPALQRLEVVVMNPPLFRQLLARIPLAGDWLGDPRVALRRAEERETVGEPFAAAPGWLRLAGPDEASRRLADAVRLELATPFIQRDFRHHPLMRQRLTENLPVVARDGDVAALFGAWRGESVVVAGAGPTLSDHLPRFRAHRGKFRLVAVEAALRPLLRGGVIPDAVVTLDPFPIMAALFAGLPPGLERTPLIYFPVVDPLVLDSWPGPRRVAYAESPLYEEARRTQPRGVLFTAGSVIHPALDLAIRSGAGTILLAGTDFSFPGGKTHAAGYADLATLKISGGSVPPLLDGWGGEVATTPAFRHYLRELEEQIARTPGVRFVNGSRRGAVIAGTLPLDETTLFPGDEAPPSVGEGSASSEEGDAAPETLSPEAWLARGGEALAARLFPEAEAAFRAARRGFADAGASAGLGWAAAGLAALELDKGRPERALAALTEEEGEAAPGEDPPALEVRRLRLQGSALVKLGDLTTAAPLLERAFALVRALDDPLEEAAVREAVGLFFIRRGRELEAAQQWESALELQRERGDRRGMVRIHALRGDEALRRGQWDEAERHFQRMVSVADGVVDRAEARNRLFLLAMERINHPAQERGDCLGLLDNAVRAFRLGEEGRGHEGIRWLVDCLTRRMSSGDPKLVEKLLPALKTLIAAQQRNDECGVADCLEYQIKAILSSSGAS
ncbi:MAG: DUF115 domain-containing protein [Magnetococcales bacterium]|nr:DUF115 domain-containing protein [Magnetococcales bacterium]